tara:strand:+ start:8059 stop:8766 length:708 start_codon:yes stop_codon:yes gene_type:complete
MIKKISSLLIIFILQLSFCNDLIALPDSTVKQFLINREKQYPQWYLSKLKYTNLEKDLIYPDWFEGSWIVESRNSNDLEEDPLIYKVKFFKNNDGEVVGDRLENSKSIGKAIYGKNLINIKKDPSSFNNQIIYLADEEYIESRVVGRNQIFDSDLFFSDEFFIQTTHKEGISRINQVEVMSKFFRCPENQHLYNDKYSDICGLQYVGTYGSKIGDLNLKAITTNQYKLNFRSGDQ